VQGYLLIDLRAYDAASDRNIWSWREAAPREEIYSYLGEAAGGLMRIVVGADYSILALHVTPGGAAISLDGEQRTAGSLITTPGHHVLSVAAPDCIPEQRELDLPSGVETTVQIALNAVEGVPMTVESDPPGASVYVDSVRQGRTPWTMDKPSLKRHLLLSMDGYLDGTGRADLLSPQVLSVRMDTDLSAPDQVQKDQRDRFYVSFGALSVSIPVPLFLFFASQDFSVAAAKAKKSGFPNADSLASAGNLCLWSAVGGVAACVGLFTYMVFTIMDYIAAADRPAG
jgi:hypothetical protein